MRYRTGVYGLTNAVIGTGGLLAFLILLPLGVILVVVGDLARDLAAGRVR